MATKEQFPKNEEERMKLLNSLPKELQELYVGASTEEIKSIIEKRANFHFAPPVDEKHPYEIWVMVQKSKIISAWKYPGRTKIGEPLPFEILEEIRNIRV